MPIKRPDGNPYVLRGPNPIMKSQNVWDGFKVHNMTYEEVTYKPRAVRVRNKAVEVQADAETSPPQQEVITEESGPVTLALPERNPTKLYCHVLPAVYKTTTDPLYGDQTTKLVYGEKYTTELALHSMTADSFATFWTNGVTEMNKGSIIFVGMDKRWWKVTGYRKVPEGGIFIECIVSDQTPSFSS